MTVDVAVRAGKPPCLSLAGLRQNAPSCLLADAQIVEQDGFGPPEGQEARRTGARICSRERTIMMPTTTGYHLS